MGVFYNLRTYVHALNGSVMIRVRWEHKTRTVVFSCGVYADKSKWDCDQQKAQRNTMHTVNSHCYSAREINAAIAERVEIIGEAFSKYEANSLSPTVIELKEYVKQKLSELHPKRVANPPRESSLTMSLPHIRSLSSVFDEYIAEQKDAMKWRSNTSAYHYGAVKNHIEECVRCSGRYDSMPIGDVDTRFMNDLKRWYVNKGYNNKTAKRNFRYFKTVLRWAKTKRYPVKDEALFYKDELEDPEKTVVFLKYDELIHFLDYEFPEGGRLDRSRDCFCFMAFTGLRISDLRKLKKDDVTGETIKIYTKKTHKPVLIPITSKARQIIDKYKDTEKGEYLFNVRSTQKINDYIKDAAKEAGLNKLITEVHGEGKSLVSKTSPLHEIMTCHVARKTFICISLRLGIPAEVVMKSTGHSNYAAMKPYIEIMEESVTEQMQKWDTPTTKGQESIEDLRAQLAELQKKIEAAEKGAA